MPLDRAVQHDRVLRVPETVAFVLGDQILDRDTAFAQPGDDIVGFGLHDMCVVGALSDEQRGADPVHHDDRERVGIGLLLGISGSPT